MVAHIIGEALAFALLIWVCILAFTTEAGTGE